MPVAVFVAGLLTHTQSQPGASGAGWVSWNRTAAAEPNIAPAPTVVVTDCAVVVAGGSTAALATAVASAKEGVRTCLLEPTECVLPPPPP